MLPCRLHPPLTPLSSSPDTPQFQLSSKAMVKLSTQEIKELAAKHSYSEEEIEAIAKCFGEYDADDSNSLDSGEFAKLTSDLGEAMSDTEIKEAIAALDADNNGTIDFHEFIKWWAESE